MDRDRNLLFGIFAVQLGKVSPHELVRAGGAWAADPARELATVLVEMGAMADKDVHLIQALVDEAVREHAGDPAATLEAFGGPQAVQQSFRGSVVVTDSGAVRALEGAFDEPENEVAVLETPGRYSHQREYAKGGMGRVLLVHDEQMGRDVALKELLPHVVGSTDTTEPQQGSPVRMTVPLVARFLREAKITGQLEHPSIVPVYELGKRADGSVYYTMKLVRGRTLSQAIRQAESLQERLKLLPHFVDLCQAIAYAHSRGVVHRDIKPGNVMVGEFGETVVLDWGLAKVRDVEDLVAEDLAESLRVLSMGDSNELMKTAYGQAIGTPAYMAPEQAKGQLDEIDERTDVYALGVVLYELLTGKVPFEGTTLKETLERVIKDPPRPVLDLEPMAPAELAAVCAKAISKSKDARYPTTLELSEEVQRFQAGALVQAYEYKVADRVSRFVSRHRAILMTTAAAILVLLVVGVISYMRLARANAGLMAAEAQEREQRIAAEASQRIAEAARAAEAEARETAEISLERAQRLAYPSVLTYARKLSEQNAAAEAWRILHEQPPGFRGFEWAAHIVDLDDSEVTLIGDLLDVLFASFDESGERVVVRENGRPLGIFDAASGWRVEAPAHIRAKASSDFDPDYRSEVALAAGLRLRMWDGGDGVRAAHVHDLETRQVVWTLSGSVARNNNSSTRSFTPNRAEAKASVTAAAFSPDERLVVIGTEHGLLDVYSVENRNLLGGLDGHTDAVNSVHFSEDGRKLATTSDDGTVRVWDVDEMRLVTTVAGGESPMRVGRLSRDSRLVAAVNEGRISVWRTDTGELLAEKSGHEGRITGLDFSQDGRRLVSWSRNGIVKIWDMRSDSVFERADLSGRVTAAPATIIERSEVVYFRSADSEGWIAIASDGAFEPFTINVPSDFLFTVMYAADSGRLCVEFQEKDPTRPNIFLYDVATGTRIGSARCPGVVRAADDLSFVVGLDPSPDGKTGELAFGFFGSGHPADGKKIPVKSRFVDVNSRESGHVVRTGSHIFEVTEEELVVSVVPEEESGSPIQAGSSRMPVAGGRRYYILTPPDEVMGGQESESPIFKETPKTGISVYDTRTDELVYHYEHDQPIAVASYDEHHQRIGVISSTATPNEYDLETLDIQSGSVLESHALRSESAVWNLGSWGSGVVFSPRQEHVAVYLRGSFLELWDLRDDTVAFSLRGEVDTAIFSPTGDALVVVSKSETSVWHLDVAPLSIPGLSVDSWYSEPNRWPKWPSNVQIDPTWTRLSDVSPSGVLRIRDMETGTILTSYDFSERGTSLEDWRVSWPAQDLLAVSARSGESRVTYACRLPFSTSKLWAVDDTRGKYLPYVYSRPPSLVGIDYPLWPMATKTETRFESFDSRAALASGLVRFGELLSRPDGQVFREVEGQGLLYVSPDGVSMIDGTLSLSNGDLVVGWNGFPVDSAESLARQVRGASETVKGSPSRGFYASVEIAREDGLRIVPLRAVGLQPLQFDLHTLKAIVSKGIQQAIESEGIVRERGESLFRAIAVGETSAAVLRCEPTDVIIAINGDQIYSYETLLLALQADLSRLENGTYDGTVVQVYRAPTQEIINLDFSLRRE